MKRPQDIKTRCLVTQEHVHSTYYHGCRRPDDATNYEIRSYGIDLVCRTSQAKAHLSVGNMFGQRRYLKNTYASVQTKSGIARLDKGL